MSLDKSRANILTKYLDQLTTKFDEPLVIVETGSIRNVAPQYVLGDGHSTHIVANWLLNQNVKHAFYSVDLSIVVAKKYLEKLGLIKYVNLIQSDSRAFLEEFPGTFHLGYLDSANDATLILEEFQILENKMVPGGIVVIDDCHLNSPTVVKGHKVIPYATKAGYDVTVKNGQGVIRF